MVDKRLFDKWDFELIKLMLCRPWQMLSMRRGSRVLFRGMEAVMAALVSSLTIQNRCVLEFDMFVFVCIFLY